MNLQPWRSKPKQGVHAEPLVAGTEVLSGAERVGAHEYAAVRPPERDLVPVDLDEDERVDGIAGDHVMLHAQPPRDRGAVAVVAIEQLGHSRDMLELVHARAVDGIDQPRATFDDQRVRRTLEELVLDPLDYSVQEATQRSK